MSPFLAITLLLFKSCHSFAAPFGIPVLAPLFGNACQEDVCGRGNCVVSNSSNFGFECQCESGWRQARSEDDDELSFLPCVVPNCTLDYSCANAAPPAPGNPYRANMSFFDPCYWTDCGGGTCNKTSLFSRECLCEEGYYNLFNSSAFPCYHQCSIGADCPNLGLNLTDPTTSDQDTSPTSANDNSTTTTTTTSSIAASLIPGVEVAWFVTVLTTFALSAWKNT